MKKYYVELQIVKSGVFAFDAKNEEDLKNKIKEQCESFGTCLLMSSSPTFNIRHVDENFEPTSDWEKIFSYED